MAGQVAIMDQSFVVAESMTNGVGRYRAVVATTNDSECAYATAAGAGKFLGISQEDKDAGFAANIRMIGTSFAIASGPISNGDDVIIGDAQGGLATAVGAAGTPVIVGKALSHASAAGDQFLMLIKP